MGDFQGGFWGLVLKALYIIFFLYFIGWNLVIRDFLGGLEMCFQMGSYLLVI